MVVREGEYLLLQQGQKLFMLLRSGSKFHLFTVDKRFTEEREEKLMQLYPCSEETLRELGVTFTAWYVRGVAAGGCDAGEELILYIGKKKHRYTLSDDYTQEQMSRFFEGIEKHPMPKKKYKPSDWRLEKQHKELIPLMKGIKYVLLVLSIGSCAGLLFHHPAWSILGIGVSLCCGALDLVYPQYFTLLDLGKNSNQKHAIGLSLSASLPIMVQALYVFARYNYLTMEIFFWSAGLGIVICIIFGLWCREMADRTGDLLAMLLLLVMFLSGPIGMVNALTDRAEPEISRVTVEDKYISAGKSTSHYCTVILKSGEKFDLEVTSDQYDAIAAGQQISIALHPGGLGIEYISLVEF